VTNRKLPFPTREGGGGRGRHKAPQWKVPPVPLPAALSVLLHPDSPPATNLVRSGADAHKGRGTKTPLPQPPDDDLRPLAAGSDATTLALDALQRGRRAMAAGNADEAVRWLDRAHRLAPADGTVTLTLASACLHGNPRRSENLSQSVAETTDVRAAWFGLAVARLSCGNATGAAEALATALARHTPEPALLSSGETLADLIARRAAAAGWCGLTGDGRLVIRPTGTGATEVRLDDEPILSGALPRTWPESREISVLVSGRHLLGSPIQIGAIRRVVGFVEACQGGLCGWAWYPGDPDNDPQLLIQDNGFSHSLPITAADQTVAVSHAGPLARPRGFVVPADALAGLPRPLHVCGRDGGDLLGSPLDPDAEQAAAAAAATTLAQYLSPKSSRASKPVRIAPFAAPAIPVPALPLPLWAWAAEQTKGGRRGRTTANSKSSPLPPALVRSAAQLRKGRGSTLVPTRPVAIVIPVYGRTATVLACLDSVFASLTPPHRIIVVDDASPDHDLRQALDRLARERRIRLIRHARNQGFPASANDGMSAAAGHDVILLNSDTLVPPGWLERLRDACHATLDIGTATPFSNDASILSYPGPTGTNPLPDLAATRLLNNAARRANGHGVIAIPVGVGFCLYIRRDCIDAVGPFRADVFAQGYGEENDFCLRARHLGWRNVAVPGVFVAHLAGASFGSAGRHLRARNDALLNRLHPGYDRLIAEFCAADPLAAARRRIDLLRWRAETRGCTGSAILITHDDGGGVERQVGVSAARHRAAGLRSIILRPELRTNSGPLVVIDGAAAGFPNLGYALPAEMPGLLRLLGATSPHLVELHHTLHHPPAILDLVTRLGVPYDVFVHDYPWICPQVALVGPTRRYCGEPNRAGCEACVADAGHVIDEDISVRALRERSASFLAGARRVVAPSDDAAVRMRNYFPGLRLTVVPQEDDASIADPPRPQPRDERCRVCLLGAIGVHKGFDILLACARDAEERGLPLDFTVVGHTIDDARLLASGRVFVTGRFRQEEAVPLIRAQRASLALLPSVWPETWSFALTELWLAGLMVAAFDIGAPAERIRRTGRGLLLPFGMPARGINNALLAAVGLTGHQGA
jgi:GT2 family glycosyltransferase